MQLKDSQGNLIRISSTPLFTTPQAEELMKKSYEEKVDDFIRQRGPFTYEGWATFSPDHGFESHPLEFPEIPQQACQACGSKRPSSFQLLTDRFGALVIIGRECERKLQLKRAIIHHSEDSAG